MATRGHSQIIPTYRITCLSLVSRGLEYTKRMQSELEPQKAVPFLTKRASAKSSFDDWGHRLVGMTGSILGFIHSDRTANIRVLGL